MVIDALDYPIDFTEGERERILKIIKKFRDPKLSLKKCKRIRRLLIKEIKSKN